MNNAIHPFRQSLAGFVISDLNALAADIYLIS